MRLHLDTGSSDLWVNTPSSNLCSASGSPCGQSGTYDPNSSSTYQYVNSNFLIQYVDQSGAQGDLVTDVFAMGNAVLKAFQFAVGYKSSSKQAVLGIGYPKNEATATTQNSMTYPNLPYALLSAGIIKTPAYSLWLNDLDSSTGTILFGGVNTEKFVGQLSTLPIQTYQSHSSPTEFTIALTGLTVNDGSSTTTLARGGAFSVLLDSGASFCYLPDQIFQGLVTSLNGEIVGGNTYVDCALKGSTGYVEFTFSSPKIRVPLRELVLLPSENGDSSTAAGTTGEKEVKRTLRDGRNACVLGVSPAGQSTNILGDTFLRSAYVVYDLQNNQISLAQTQFNSTSDNILEIQAGSAGVPSATGVVNPASATGAQTGIGRIGNPTSATPSPTSSPKAKNAGSASSGPLPLMYLAAAVFAGAMALLA